MYELEQVVCRWFSASTICFSLLRLCWDLYQHGRLGSWQTMHMSGMHRSIPSHCEGVSSVSAELQKAQQLCFSVIWISVHLWEW